MRVERRWDRAEDMGAVVLGVGGMAIGLVVELLLLEEELECGSSVADAAAAVATVEEEDEPPAMAALAECWLTVRTDGGLVGT